MFALIPHPPSGSPQPILLPRNGKRHLLRRCQECFDGNCEAVHDLGHETILLSLGVSRRHLEVWVDEEQNACYVRDLKSTNGVYINSVRIVPMRAHECHPGDVLTLQTTPDEPPSYTFKLSQHNNTNNNNNNNSNKKRPAPVSACPTPSPSSTSLLPSTSSHKRRRSSSPDSSPDDDFRRKYEESQRTIQELQQRLGKSVQDFLFPTLPPTQEEVDSRSYLFPSPVVLQHSFSIPFLLCRLLLFLLLLLLLLLFLFSYVLTAEAQVKSSTKNKKKSESLEMGLECFHCFNTMAFPVTISGCDCDAGQVLCYQCWHDVVEFNGRDDCVICHKQIKSIIKNLPLAQLADDWMKSKVRTFFIFLFHLMLMLLLLLLTFRLSCSSLSLSLSVSPTTCLVG